MKQKLEPRYYAAIGGKMTSIDLGPLDGSLTDADLAQIHRYTLRSFTPDEIYVRKIQLANDLPDRDYEQFPDYYLDRFAETLPGKSFLEGHNWSSRPIGLWFDASVEKRGDATWVVGKTYMPKTPGNQELRDHIDAGVYRWCSIGFSRPYDMKCSICNGNLYDYDECRHYPGQDYGEKGTCIGTYAGPASKVEALEGSLVYLGAQYGAGVEKSLVPHAGKRMDETLTDVSELLESALAAAESLIARSRKIQGEREAEGRALSRARVSYLKAIGESCIDLARVVETAHVAKDAPTPEQMLALKKQSLQLRADLFDLGIDIETSRAED